MEVLRLNVEQPKIDVAKSVRDELESLGHEVVEEDFKRPWGGFIRVSDQHAQEFIKDFFQDIPLPQTTEGAKLDPKILFVESGKKLSWQVHDRRAEFWRVIRGPVGVYLSQTDEQPDDPQIFNVGDTIDMPVGTRHRLAGLDKNGLVAEIWINTDPANPSDENDIRRISDDFGR